MDSGNEEGDWAEQHGSYGSSVYGQKRHGNYGEEDDVEDEEDLEDDDDDDNNNVEEENEDGEQEIEDEEEDEDLDDDNEDELEDDEEEEAQIVDGSSVPGSFALGSKNEETLDDDDDEDEEVEDEEEEADDEEDNEEPSRKRPRFLAFAYLQGQTNHHQSTLSAPAQRILKNLLKDQHYLKNNDVVSEADMAAALSIVSKQNLHLMDKRTVVDHESSSRSSNSGMTDLQIVQLARADQLSFLGSFLAVLQDELYKKKHAPVPARILIKRSCLAISPKLVPAGLDAEEMAMAALEFLSSSFAANNGTSSRTINNSNCSEQKQINLPLIRHVKEENDIKKRSYVKVGSWDYFGDVAFQQKVMALETRFLSDATSFKFLRRFAFCPPTLEAQEDLDFLMRKGKHKIVASAPKKKPQGFLRGGGSGSKAKFSASRAGSAISPRSHSHSFDGEGSPF